MSPMSLAKKPNIEIITALYAVTHPKAKRIGLAESSFVVYEKRAEGIPMV
jgi:hypothetical protein